ncbi:unnamed protein product [Closterium sp. NIES-65]|nr:unnamed protein product [Closterium sp. NIES-65]
MFTSPWLPSYVHLALAPFLCSPRLGSLPMFTSPWLPSYVHLALAPFLCSPRLGSLPMFTSPWLPSYVHLALAPFPSYGLASALSFPSVSDCPIHKAGAVQSGSLWPSSLKRLLRRLKCCAEWVLVALFPQTTFEAPQMLCCATWVGLCISLRDLQSVQGVVHSPPLFITPFDSYLPISPVPHQALRNVGGSMRLVLRNVGLCISLHDLQAVEGGFIFPSDPGPHFTVRFRLVVFSPFAGEVLVGRLVKCDATGLFVSLDFFSDVHIPHYNLQEPSVFDEQEKLWVWKFNDNDMFLDMDELIRFKVVSVKYPALPVEQDKGATAFATMEIVGDINGDGLGLLSWWSSFLALQPLGCSAKPVSARALPQRIVAMTLKLYTSPHNKNAYKALIAAQFVGVKIEIPPYQWGVTNKSEEFSKLTPIGKIPLIVTPDGPIFESNAIARYVARLADKGLFGSNAYEQAQVEQWIDFATNEIDSPVTQWIGPLYQYGNRIQEVEEKAIVNAKRGLAALNSHLADHTYLVGERVTLADIITVSVLTSPIRGLWSEEFMRDYPHVQRYFFTLVHQKQFKAVIGDVEQIAKVPTEIVKWEDSPLFKLMKPKQDDKAAAPAAAAAAPAGGGEGEEGAPKPKAKNPLDLLPASPMVLDVWKRLYSNTKANNFREVAIKGFWEMFDPEGYSLWFCDYKFNDENTVKFVTLNKVSGFLQRMDLARKYAFAKMCILGPDEGPFVIKGVWLFRGSEVPPFVMEECYDCELYEWSKVDLSDEAQKERVNAYFEEPDEVDGLKLQEAKCFK